MKIFRIGEEFEEVKGLENKRIRIFEGGKYQVSTSQPFLGINN